MSSVSVAGGAAAAHSPWDGRGNAALLGAVALVAGAVIALQITVMRVFAVGSWAHFGSLVVSLAMFGFGLTSAVMCINTRWFEARWRPLAALALLAFGPLAVASQLLAQRVPFNAIFLVADATQKWRLALNFVLYLLPFLAGALFLGVVFQQSRKHFNRIYFADLAGSGLCGLVLLLSMYVLAPEDLILTPLLLWAAGAWLWFTATGQARLRWVLAAVAALTAAAHLLLPAALGTPKIAVSDYKGVSYARKFPDAQRVVRSTSPFGLLEVYSSSYLHFAPGLSDNAAFTLPKMPQNAYLGLYIDSDGPAGVIRQLPPQETAYFRSLPLIYPYLLKTQPDTFVAQFGGGLSTAVALASGARQVTVAEGHRGVLAAFREEQALRDFTGDILNRPNVSVIDQDARLVLAGQRDRYDIIDLSLADSTGLSSPGGFAIAEKYAYTRQAFGHYLRALKPDGVLAVTIWNKEEPPKSVLKLYRTLAAAARDVGGPDIAPRFFVVSAYLSTATVLYKRNGFSADEVKMLREHTQSMSFDEIYSPGLESDAAQLPQLLADYRAQIFGNGTVANAADAAAAPAAASASTQVTGAPGTAAPAALAGPKAGEEDIPGGPPPGAGIDASAPGGADGGLLPAAKLARLAWLALVADRYDEIAEGYVFDTRLLTNAHPYFAAYVKSADLWRATDRLELLQDEWGYLLLWATLAVACAAAATLVLLPLAFGWRTIFSGTPGKGRTIVYFACLGLGYIMVEVGLIAHFVMALGNATISASVLITGMLVFSGLGSLVSERVLPRASRTMPLIFAAIGALLIGCGFLIDPVLDAIGTLPYGLRLLACFSLIGPVAFLMGFPMPVAMTTLGRLGKDSMFLWAWGINGCFSVIGAALVPVLATTWGLPSVLAVSGAAYLLAGGAFSAVLLPAGRGSSPAAP